MSKQVTSMEDIRAQAEPDIIEIPGFRPGKTICVAVRMIDITPYIMESGIGNPLVAIAMKKAKEGKSKEQIEKELDEESKGKPLNVEALMPAMDAVVKEALIKPTYEEITAIHPLTMDQKLAIFEYATGDASGLASFRSE